MKDISILFFCLLAASVAVTAVGASSCAGDAKGGSGAENVAITFHLQDASFTSAEGVWSASGAINDLGTMFGNFEGDFRLGGAVMTFDSLQGATGSINIEREGIITSLTSTTFPTSGTISGVWVIVDGTGIYAEAQGEGTWTAAFVSPGPPFPSGTLLVQFLGEVK